MSIKIYVKYVKNNRDFYTTKMNLPTGNLDSNNSTKIMELFVKANREFKTTILMVTHSEKDRLFANKTIEVKDGQLID